MNRAEPLRIEHCRVRPAQQRDIAARPIVRGLLKELREHGNAGARDYGLIETASGGAEKHQEGSGRPKRKRTVAHLPKKTRTALGKQGAKAARKKRRR